MPDKTTPKLYAASPILGRNLATIPVYLSGTIANTLFEYLSFQVVASFERSFYLRVMDLDTSSLICICKGNLEPGPLNALCRQWPETGLPLPGSHFRRLGNSLYGESLSIDLSEKQVWAPRQKPYLNPAHISKGLQKAVHLMAQRSPEKLGLAVALPYLFPCHALSNFCPYMHKQEDAKSANVAIITNPTTADNVLTAMSIEGLEKLYTFLQGDNASLSEAIGSLIGLGSGLTPSGDDVLGGVMIALHLSGDILHAKHFADTLQDFSSHTNAISQAHLAAASQGMGAAPLHDWGHAIMTNQDMTVFHSLAQRIDTIGHTSGWDAALGMYLTFFSALSDTES